MGGTVILPALAAILKDDNSPNGAHRPPCPRQLFIFSDGHIDNDRSEILDLLRTYSSNTTAFTFGIGGARFLLCHITRILMKWSSQAPLMRPV